MGMYFGSVYAILTTVLVAAMIIFIVLAVRNRERIPKWGKWIALFVAAGTAISAISAMRDNYGAQGALFAMDSVQSLLCSIIGGAVFGTAFVSIFFRKNQAYKRRCFYIMAVLFIANVALVEVSRLMLLA